MNTFPHHPLDRVINVILSCMLLFLTGGLYSFGIFASSVEKAARPPGALDGVWSASMALISLFCTPLMVFTGLYINEGTLTRSENEAFGKSKTDRLRILTIVGAAFFSLFAFAAYGVVTSSRTFIRLGFSVLGAGMGVFYLIGLELITAWTPHRPGLAVGIAQMCFGFGTILFSALFNFLNNSYGAVGALYISTVVLTAPCALSSCALKWPESTTCIVAQPLNYALESPHDDGDTYTRPCRAIRWQRLPFLSSFWLYMATIFVGQLGYAFLPYYFSIGESFGVSMSVVLLAFQGANLVSTLSRPFAGMLTDALKTSQGFFSIGTKNVLLILISVQTGLFFLLIPISRAHYFGLFVIASGIILSIFAAFACCASLLAREQFGWKSSTAVFGLGGGIAMCLGEFAAVMMMSACISSENGKDTTAYNGFYLVSGMCSLAGLVCCIFVKRCRQAFCLDDDGFGQTFVGKPGDETRGFADVCVGYGSVERHVCAEAIDGA